MVHFNVIMLLVLLRPCLTETISRKEPSIFSESRGRFGKTVARNVDVNLKRVSIDVQARGVSSLMPGARHKADMYNVRADAEAPLHADLAPQMDLASVNRKLLEQEERIKRLEATLAVHGMDPASYHSSGAQSVVGAAPKFGSEQCRNMGCHNQHCQCGGIDSQCCGAHAATLALQGGSPCTDNVSARCSPCNHCMPETPPTFGSQSCRAIGCHNHHCQCGGEASQCCGAGATLLALQGGSPCTDNVSAQCSPCNHCMPDVPLKFGSPSCREIGCHNPHCQCGGIDSQCCGAHAAVLALQGGSPCSDNVSAQCSPCNHCTPEPEAYANEATVCPDDNGIVGYSFSHNGFWNQGFHLQEGNAINNAACAELCNAHKGCVRFNRISGGTREGECYLYFDDKGSVVHASPNEAYVKC